MKKEIIIDGLRYSISAHIYESSKYINVNAFYYTGIYSCETIYASEVRERKLLSLLGFNVQNRLEKKY